MVVSKKSSNVLLKVEVAGQILNVDLKQTKRFFDTKKMKNSPNITCRLPAIYS